MEFITIPLVVGIITLGIYRLFELFARRKERIMLIEKLGVCPDLQPLNLQNLFPAPLPLPQRSSHLTLKLACLLMGIGMGILFGLMFCIAFSRQYPNYPDEALVGASTLLFGGLGLLIAYFIERKDIRTKEKEVE